MAENRIPQIIGVVVALILMGTLLPIALVDLVAYTGAYNSSISGSEVSGTNATVGTLVGTVLPILIVVALMTALVMYRRKS